MKIVDYEFLKTAPNGTMFMPIDNVDGNDIPLGSPMVIYNHAETSANSFVEGLISFEPWPAVDGKFREGPASFEGLMVDSTDFFNCNKYLIFEHDDLVKILQIVMYSMSGGKSHFLLGLVEENKEKNDQAANNRVVDYTAFCK